MWALSPSQFSVVHLLSFVATWVRQASEAKKYTLRRYHGRILYRWDFFDWDFVRGKHTVVFKKLLLEEQDES